MLTNGALKTFEFNQCIYGYNVLSIKFLKREEICWVFFLILKAAGCEGKE